MGSGRGTSKSFGSGSGDGSHKGDGKVNALAQGSSTVETTREGAGSGHEFSGFSHVTSGDHEGVGSPGVSKSFVHGQGIALDFSTDTLADINIRLFDDGDLGEFCPDFQKVEYTDIYNGQGVVAVHYKRDGKNYDLLVSDRREGALFDGEEEIPGTRFMVQQFSLDAIQEGQDTVDIACPVWVAARLTEGIVYPPNWPTPSEILKHSFAAKSPGFILGTLIQECRDRGALTDLETNFSSTETSDGDPWDFDVTLEIDTGQDIWSVLQKLVDMGVCDWFSDKRELILRNPDSGADLTVGETPVIFQRGRDLLDAPTSFDGSGLKTALLVKGEEGQLLEVDDDAGVSLYGRIEGFTSHSGVTDPGTLQIIGESLLYITATPNISLTHQLSMYTVDGPQPWVDYFPGDFVYRDIADGNGPKVYRIAQLTMTYDDSGMLSGTVTLGDRFAEIDETLVRRIDALTGGSQGSSAPASDPDITDTIAPSAPTGLLVDSQVYDIGGGAIATTIIASFNEVLTNTDGSPYDDHSHYEAQWHTTLPDDSGWRNIIGDSDNVITFSPVPPNIPVEVRVRAVDTNSNASDWTTSDEFTTAFDNEAPPVPTGVTVDEFLGTIRLNWDGTGLNSLAEIVDMPADFKFSRVHGSSVSGFTADETNRLDQLPGPGISVIADLEYGTTYYFKLIAEDIYGNLSDPSVQFEGTPRDIGFADISFKDRGNMVDDGSFESAAKRAERTSGPFSFTDAVTTQHGVWALIADASVGSGDRDLILTPKMPVFAGADYLARFYARAEDANSNTVADPNGNIQFRASWYDVDDVFINDSNLEITPSGITWQNNSFIASSLRGAVQASYVQFKIRIPSACTVGRWFVDAAEWRERTGTLLVQDAAITNAKIANVSVGKLTAGSLTADMTVSARIKTADTGQRVEMDSNGIKKYDSGNNLVVEITDTLTRIQGRLTTGDLSGSHIDIGGSTDRDTIVVYDILNKDVVAIGQVYDSVTGDPVANGILVQDIDIDDDPGAGTSYRDMFYVYGSGDTSRKGMYFAHTPGNLLAMDFRHNQRHRVRVFDPADTDIQAQMTAIFNGGGTYRGMGFQEKDGTNRTVFLSYEEQLYFQGNFGGNVYLRSDTATVHGVMYCDNAGGRWGLEGTGGDMYGFQTNDVFTTISSRATSGSPLGFVQCVDFFGGAYVNVRLRDVECGSVFYSGSLTFTSEMALKKNIEEAPESAIDILRNAPTTLWNYTHEEEGTQKHFTPMSDHLPEWMQTPSHRVTEVADPLDSASSPTVEEAVGYDLNSMIGLLWQAVRELDEELDQLTQLRKNKPVRRKSITKKDLADAKKVRALKEKEKAREARNANRSATSDQPATRSTRRRVYGASEDGSTGRPAPEPTLPSSDEERRAFIGARDRAPEDGGSDKTTGDPNERGLPTGRELSGITVTIDTGDDTEGSSTGSESDADSPPREEDRGSSEESGGSSP